MDPQACLDRAATAFDNGELDETMTALGEYADWRRRGGFAPADGDRTAYRLLDKAAHDLGLARQRQDREITAASRTLARLMAAT